MVFRQQPEFAQLAIDIWERIIYLPKWMMFRSRAKVNSTCVLAHNPLHRRLL